MDKVTFDTGGGPSVHLGVLEGKVSNNIITGGSAGRILKAALMLDGAVVEPFTAEELSAYSPLRLALYLESLHSVQCNVSDRLHVTVNGTYKGMPVTLSNTGMGPSSVSITLPELIEACTEPDMIILRLGTSGGLRSDMNVGDLVVSKGRIYYNDGVTKDIAYPGFIAVPDHDVAVALEETAMQYKLPFQAVYAGPTKTVRELYFTNAEMRRILADPAETIKYQARNDEYPMPLVVSMEGSVYAALAHRYKGLRIGEAFLVSDIVAPKTEAEIARATYDRNKADVEPTVNRIGFETILRLRG